jgi:hypothetical protein
MKHLDRDKLIKKIIEQIVINNIEKNLFDKKIDNNKILNIDSLNKYYNLNKLKIKGKKDVKNIFRYMENNHYVENTVQTIYKKYIDYENNNLCSGYELIIDLLEKIELSFSKKLYDKLIQNNEINEMLNEYKKSKIIDISIEDYEDYEQISTYIQFNYDFNINNDNAINALRKILILIIKQCKNDIIPIQVDLKLYSDKNLRIGDVSSSYGRHRTFILFKKIKYYDENNNILEKYIGYYYDPEGEINTYYYSKIHNIFESLNSDIIHIHYLQKFCPIGIQKIQGQFEFSLCTVYSYFWYNVFIQCVHIIKKYDNKYGTELSKMDMINYIKDINDNIIKYSYNLNDNINNKYVKNKILGQMIQKFNKKELTEKIFINYALSIIGKTFKENILNEDEKNKMIEYIETSINSY